MVSAEFFRVHGFRNVSVTTCSAWSQTKLFANDLQVITLTNHNDVISCFICWYKHIFVLEFFETFFHQIQLQNSLQFGFYCLPETVNLRSNYLFHMLYPVPKALIFFAFFLCPDVVSPTDGCLFSIGGAFEV